MIVARDGLGMVVHLQDRGCCLHKRLVEEGVEGCDRVRKVIEVGACCVLAPPSWS